MVVSMATFHTVLPRAPGQINSPVSFACSPHSRKARLKTSRAATEAEECNDEACAPEKEVGKVSMEWLAEEKTRITGTFPPMGGRKWTGYVEKDTAGQTNIYSVEPPVYVADTAISSGSQGADAQGSQNIAAISAGLGLIFIAGASSILLQVGKSKPGDVAAEYSGPPLSYYIQKFNTPVAKEISATVEVISSPAINPSPPLSSTETPALPSDTTEATTQAQQLLN